MSVLLFSLRGVPDDEAWDIRALLSDHEIEFYETGAGNWGISLPAIWLKNEQELEKSRLLIEEYQQQRLIKQRAMYRQLKKSGNDKTIFSVFKENPLQFIVYLVLIFMVLYVSVKVILEFGL